METLPSLLKFNPDDNGRAFPYQTADLADLLLDLSEGRPIRERVLVQEVNDELWVLAGIRRTMAGQEWEKTNPDYLLPIELVENMNPLDALILNIRENVARKELSIIDIGSNASRLRAHGKTGAEIISILGLKSEGQVSQAIKLFTDLPEYIQLMVANKTITADDAFTLLKIEDGAKRSEVLRGYLESKANAALTSARQNGENVSLDVISPDRETNSPPPPSNKKKAETLREMASNAGADLGAMRMTEFKKYLQEAVDMEGPGSHKGEMVIKKLLLQLLDRSITPEIMDTKLQKIAREKW